MPPENQKALDALKALQDWRDELPMHKFTPEQFRAWENEKAVRLQNLWAIVTHKSFPNIEAALTAQAVTDGETLKLGMAFKTKCKGTPCYVVGFVLGGNPLLRFDETGKDGEYAMSFQSLPLSSIVRDPSGDICEYFPQNTNAATHAPDAGLVKALEGVMPLLDVDCPDLPDGDCVGWQGDKEIPVTFGQIRAFKSALAAHKAAGQRGDLSTVSSYGGGSVAPETTTKYGTEPNLDSYHPSGIEKAITYKDGFRAGLEFSAELKAQPPQHPDDAAVDAFAIVTVDELLTNAGTRNDITEQILSSIAQEYPNGIKIVEKK